MAEKKFIIDNGFSTDADSEITGSLTVSGTVDASAFTVNGSPLSSGSGGSLSNVTDASYGANVNGKLAVSGGIDMDIGTTLKLEAGTANFSQSTVVFSGATVAGLDNETVGLDNITNSAQGVNVTGKVAATDGMDVDIGGSITAQGCTVDLSNSTVVFSGATVSGIDASVSTSASQPSSPNSGDVWFDGSTLTMYVYYVDSNSVGAWVEVGGA